MVRKMVKQEKWETFKEAAEFGSTCLRTASTDGEALELQQNIWDGIWCFQQKTGDGWDGKQEKQEKPCMNRRCLW